MSRPADPLLTLKESAERLGVHASTLRRWADQGDILVVLTPGGHRRFPSSEVERLARRREGGTPHKQKLHATLAQKALTHTRAEIAEHQDVEWMMSLDEPSRQQQRQLGQRAMGLLMTYVSSTEPDDDLLHKARSMGHTYADITQQTGLGLSMTLQALMFFRENIVESVVLLPKSVQVRPEANKILLRRVNTFLNAILQGIAESYES